MQRRRVGRACGARQEAPSHARARHHPALRRRRSRASACLILIGIRGGRPALTRGARSKRTASRYAVGDDDARPARASSRRGASGAASGDVADAAAGRGGADAPLAPGSPRRGPPRSPSPVRGPVHAEAPRACGALCCALAQSLPAVQRCFGCAAFATRCRPHARLTPPAPPQPSREDTGAAAGAAGAAAGAPGGGGGRGEPCAAATALQETAGATAFDPNRGRGRRGSARGGGVVRCQARPSCGRWPAVLRLLWDLPPLCACCGAHRPRLTTPPARWRPARRCWSPTWPKRSTTTATGVRNAAANAQHRLRAPRHACANRQSPTAREPRARGVSGARCGQQLLGERLCAARRRASHCPG